MTTSEANGYGTLAVFIICLCSIVGAILLPCIKTKVYKIGLAIFLGLAVGTLAGDALFHLLPEALGVHGHEEEEEEEEHDGVERFVLISIVAFAGVYGFYLLEMIMTLIKNRNTKVDPENNTDQATKSEELNALPNSDAEVEKGVNSEEKKESLIEKFKRVCSPLVIMIIVGDTIHNFMDGLAIGASFASSNVEGVATSIAVFCHELPHELGDFAVLLNSGMGIVWAIAANLLSSLSAFIGLYVGVAITTDESTKQFIFALTAGMFLYIALVDLLPELIKDGSSDVKCFIYHNIGIIVGSVIMLLLSIYEEKIKI